MHILQNNCQKGPSKMWRRSLIHHHEDASEDQLSHEFYHLPVPTRYLIGIQQEAHAINCKLLPGTQASIPFEARQRQDTLSLQIPATSSTCCIPLRSKPLLSLCYKFHTETPTNNTHSTQTQTQTHTHTHTHVSILTPALPKFDATGSPFALIRAADHDMSYHP